MILLAPDLTSVESGALHQNLAAEPLVSFATSVHQAAAIVQRFDYCLLCAGGVLLNPFAADMFSGGSRPNLGRMRFIRID